VPATKLGPDSYGQHNAQYKEFHLSFHSSVLHIRGSELFQQPAVSPSGNVLLWNGEVFGGVPISSSTSDTAVVAASLELTRTTEDFLREIEKIEGPYSFVYFERQNGRLWFGRDCLGRRSLLWAQGETETILCSVATQPGSFIEVDASRIFCLDLTEGQNASLRSFSRNISMVQF
jgi:asparagine synthetase B (glutamine-hydrolysing)